MKRLPDKLKPFVGVAFMAVLLTTAMRQGVFRLKPTGNVYEKSRAEQVPLRFRLEDIAERAGINHRYECFTSDESNRNVIERICAPNAAVAVADVDGDGYPDVFFTTMKEGHPNYLYHNNGDGTFTDVTEASGLVDPADKDSTTGALFFDYDNDGREDLLVLKVGCHRLYRNVGHGRFADVSAETGIDHVCGAMSAANAFDYDRDGFLDLVIGNYFEGHDLHRPQLPSSINAKQTGGPVFVLKNHGGKFFEDVTAKVGMDKVRFHTWSFGVSDVNHDGYPDLFIANDFGPAVLFENQAGKSFRDVSDASWISHAGRASMNAEFGDTSGSGSFDLYVTNVTYPNVGVFGNSLWHNRGDGKFLNLSADKGVKSCGWGWGAKFADLDRDGRLDLFSTAGFFQGKTNRSYYYARAILGGLPNFLQLDPAIAPPTEEYSLANHDASCVFVQQADGDFVDVAPSLGLTQGALGKGVAILDSRNQGVQDVIVTRSGPRPFFYKNTVLTKSHWLGLKLVGTVSNRDAWGAVVRLDTVKGTQYRELYPANGFKSESDGRIFFGLGDQSSVRSVRILWPSGKEQVLGSVRLDRYQTVEEPRGRATASKRD